MGEDKKPWEEYNSGKPKPKMFKPMKEESAKEESAEKPKSPSSEAEDTAKKIQNRNEGIVDRYGEPKSQKRRQKGKKDSTRSDSSRR